MIDLSKHVWLSRLTAILAFFVVAIGPQVGPASEEVTKLEGRNEKNGQDPRAAYFGVNAGPSPGPGVLVTSVDPRSPAVRAGIRTGDFILEIDDVQIASPEELANVIRRAKPEAQVKVVIWRDGREFSKQIRLAEPASQNTSRPRSWLGVRVVESHSPGVRIASVFPDSPAARAGLRRGDWILRIEDREINSSSTLTRSIESLAPGSNVQLTVVRGDEEQTLAVTLEGRPAAHPDGLGGSPPPPFNPDRRRIPPQSLDRDWRPPHPPYRYQYFYLPPRYPARVYDGYYYYHYPAPGVYVPPSYYNYYNWPPYYYYWYYGR